MFATPSCGLYTGDCLAPFPPPPAPPEDGEEVNVAPPPPPPLVTAEPVIDEDKPSPPFPANDELPFAPFSDAPPPPPPCEGLLSPSPPS